MERKLKVFSTLMLALFLCLGSFTVGLADIVPHPSMPPAEGGTGTVNNQAQAAITKELRVPIGTNLPSNMPFMFTVTPKNLDGDTSKADSMPVLGTPVGASNVGTFNIEMGSGAKTGTSGVSDVDLYYKESGNIFAGVTGSNIWTQPGIYAYEIVEVSTATSGTFQGDPKHDKLTYSAAKYTIYVYVKAHTDGTLYVFAVGAYKTNGEPGEPGGEKVDATPGKDGTVHDRSDMIFKNTYIRVNGPTPPGTVDPVDPNPNPDPPTDLNLSTLTVEKTVTGQFGNQDDLEFDFTVTITKNSLVPGTPTYTAFKVGQNGSIISGVKFSFVIGSNGIAKVENIKLKHGESLVFVNTPVGTHYEVEETGMPNYDPKVIVRRNDSEVANKTAGTGQNLSTEDQRIGNLLSGKADNRADFINDRDSITPTGLNLNDLPFIGMIILAVGAIAGYIFLKTRKAKKVQAK